MRKPARPHVLFNEELMRNKLSHCNGLTGNKASDNKYVSGAHGAIVGFTSNDNKAVPLYCISSYIIIIMFSKKVNNYAKKLEIFN